MCGIDLHTAVLPFFRFRSYAITEGATPDLCGTASKTRNRPPTPRSEATVCAVTKGNIAELAAKAFVALIVVFAVERSDIKENSASTERVSAHSKEIIV